MLFLGVVSRNTLKWGLTRCYSQQATKHYDIVIAGGGMIGTTLACTLGKNPKLSNKSILLLEACKDNQCKLGENYSNRVVSLNTATRNLLHNIGAWSAIEQNRLGVVKRLQVWDGLSAASLQFEQQESCDNIAYVVENDLLLAAVGDQAKTCKNLEIQYQSKVLQYHLPEYDEDNVEIQLENQHKITCSLLLGCDGVKSAVRQAMKADYISWSYDQMAIVATLTLSKEIENDVAWQRFLTTGPVALLPLNSKQSSLVWSTTEKDAQRLLQLPEDAFVEELNEAILGKPSRSVLTDATNAFDNFLRLINCSGNKTMETPPQIASIENRAGFPLGFGHSSQYIGKAVVLVGDAAHRIHPLAGQGVNLGFGDVASLNQVLGEANYSGSSICKLMYLKDYETARQRHNVPTMVAVEVLHRLYTTDLSPVVLARSLGLQTVQALQPLKKMIISHAAV